MQLDHHEVSQPIPSVEPSAQNHSEGTRAIDLPIAPLADRFLNMVLDQLAIVLFTSIVVWLFKINLYVLFFVFNYVILEGSTQQTFGKLITQTKVVTQEGNIPTTSQIIIRSLCRCIPLDALSFIPTLGNKKPIGWHDSISNTYVINSNIQREQLPLVKIDNASASHQRRCPSCSAELEKNVTMCKHCKTLVLR